MNSFKCLTSCHALLAVVGDDNHIAFYIDGEIRRVLPFFDLKTSFDLDQSAFIADNFHSAAELSEVRYFNERLTRPEIKAMYEEWLSIREGESAHPTA